MNRSNYGANTNMQQINFDILGLCMSYLLLFLISLGIQSLHCDRFYCVAIAFSFVYIISNKEKRIYNVTSFFYIDRMLAIISHTWAMSCIVCTLLVFACGRIKEMWDSCVVYYALVYFLSVLNVFIGRFIQQMSSRKHAPRVAYVGYYEDYMKFNYFLNKTNMKVEQVGYIIEKEDVLHDGTVKVLGRIENITEIIRENNIDQIFFFQRPDESYGIHHYYIDQCLQMGVTARIVMDSYVSRRSNSFVSSIGTYPIVTYHTITLNQFENFEKRVFDIILSFIALIIASPIMLVTAVAIRIDSPGPVIFRQKRVGQNGRVFDMLKFRSMYQDAEERKRELMAQNEVEGGLMFKIKDDPRITRVGKFIRMTSIDELPQLVNVFFGTMSLVGTRPPTLDEVEKYRDSQWRRISIKPGITGMWQVSGRSDITDFDKVVELDLKYIDNWSLGMDVSILFRTVFAVFRHKGSY